MKKKVIFFTLVFVVLLVFFSQAFVLKGGVEKEKVNLHKDVVYKKIHADSTYNNLQLDLVEFDLANRNLYLDNVYSGSFINTVNKTTSQLAQSHNKDGKTPLAAVNADLFMTGTHARVGGSNPVLKQALAIPRGYNVVDGEIVSTSHMLQETPYHTEMWSFGITDDFVAIISNPTADVVITNITQNKTSEADGINRLPVYNALVMYTNRGVANNYCLDDAYEIVVDITSTSRYVIKHGTDITGKVIGIYPANSTNRPTMASNSNYIIFTARGDRVSRISSYQLNDQVNIKVSVRDKTGRYTSQWQRAQTAVGGHYPFVQNGISQSMSIGVDVPGSFIGITKDGKLVMGSFGSKNLATRAGMPAESYNQLVSDLNLKDALVFDGGGSATTVIRQSDNFLAKNNPSDGGQRRVVNALVLSSGSQRNAQGKAPQVSLVDMTKLDFTKKKDYDHIGNHYDATTSYDPAKQMQIFIMTTQNGPLGEGNSRRIDLVKDGKYHKALIRLSGNIWTGSLTGLRVDFFDKATSSDVIYIKGINFYQSNPNTVARIMEPLPTPDKGNSTKAPASAEPTNANTETTNEVTLEPGQTTGPIPTDFTDSTKGPVAETNRINYSVIMIYVFGALILAALGVLLGILLIRKK